MESNISEDAVFHHYVRVQNDVNSLSNNDVHYILSTRKNELYLVTFGGGLNKLQTIDAVGNAIFKSYGVAEGLPSDILLSIREDNCLEICNKYFPLTVSPYVISYLSP